jgi:hypothetical protein
MNRMSSAPSPSFGHWRRRLIASRRAQSSSSRRVFLGDVRPVNASVGFAQRLAAAAVVGRGNAKANELATMRSSGGRAYGAGVLTMT